MLVAIEYNPEDYALVVVGTALATSLANKIVTSCLKKDVLVVECNIETSIHGGNVVRVLEK